jgi:hypothetical protein
MAAKRRSFRARTKSRTLTWRARLPEIWLKHWLAAMRHDAASKR